MKQLLILTSILLSFKSIAQQDSVFIPDPEKYNISVIYYGGLGSTYMYNALANIKPFLEKQNIAAPNQNDFGTIPIGAGFRYKRLKGQVFMSSTFMFPSSQKNQNNSIRTDQRFTTFHFGAGYNFLKQRNATFFINVGLSQIFTELALEPIPKTTKSTTFQNLISAPSSSMPLAILYLNNTAFDVSIEYLERAKRVISAGYNFRVGYRYGIKPQPWTARNVILSDAPSDRIGQFYIQAIFYAAHNRERFNKK